MRKHLEEKRQLGTPADFMLDNYGNSICKYFENLENLSKDNFASEILCGDYLIFSNYVACLLFFFPQ